MNAAVLDTSVVFKWFHHDNEEDVDAALLLRNAWMGGALEVHVPDLLVYELINSLVRKGRRTEDIEAAVSRSWVLGLTIHRVDEALSRSTVRLARKLGITAYDATFLALALELSVPLITADRLLKQQAEGGQAVVLLAEIGKETGGAQP